MTWKLSSLDHPKLKNPVLIEGLAGIGNVGKVAVDFLIDELGAKKIGEFKGGRLPGSVFITEDNLLKLPSIELWYKKGKQDLLLLAGDAQPNDDESSYELCECILNVAHSFGCTEIVTLGGIALRHEPKEPHVYITGNNTKIVQSFAKDTTARTRMYGAVGPVIGINGLLPCLAKSKKMDGVILLAETYGHPNHLGLRGAQEILKIIKKKFSLPLDIEMMEKELGSIEGEINRQELNANHKARIMRLKRGHDVNYIG